MKINSLRFIAETCRDPYLNLSIEEAILNQVHEGFSPNTLRLWINTPSLIIGSSQTSTLPNLDFCFQQGIPVARRISGGGAVYHDEGNLNWSFTMQKEDNFQGILWVYEYFGNFIAEALKGFQARLVKPNRIEVQSKKISGMAGHCKAGAFLIHGTLLVESNLRILNQICPLLVDAPPVTSLEEILGCRVKIETVVQLILDSLSRKAIRICPGKLNPREVDLAKNLYVEKYSLLTWNLGFASGRNL